MKYTSWVVLLFFIILPIAHADLINGSFESNDFTGWELEIPVGLSEFDGEQPAGIANIVDGSNIPDRSTTDGLYKACLGTGDWWFLGNQSYNITISQDFFIDTGDIVSGDAFFHNGDYEPQDHGWVSIRDNSGNEIANPWLEYSGGANPGDPNNVDYLENTDWTRWEWQADIQGYYTLVLGISTFGDNRFSCLAQFDNIAIESVPEPSILFLLGFAMITGGITLNKRRRLE